MIKDLEHYVYLEKNFLSDEICDETIKQLKKNKEWLKHNFYFPKLDKSKPISNEKELSVSYHTDGITTRNTIMDRMWYSIERYFNKYSFSWHNGWVGYLPIRFNKYNKNTLMAEHCDHIQDMFDGERKGVPILSIVGTLNDNYKGGEFIMFQDKKINLEKGDLLIFPSNFLYPHKVNEITKGIRYSYVSWTW